MTTIMITGASGNIGRILADHLKESYELTLVDIHFHNVDPALLEGNHSVPGTAEYPSTSTTNPLIALD